MIFIGPAYSKEEADRELAAIRSAGDHILASKKLREEFLTSLGHGPKAKKNGALHARGSTASSSRASVSRSKRKV